MPKQGRSWMAALTVAAGISASLGPVAPSTLADDPKPKSTAPDAKAQAKANPRAKPKAAEPPASTYVVTLDLRIAGLGKKGCDIEIKPANNGCKFKPIEQHLDANGVASIKFKDVETDSADRDCTFAIVVHEPGQPSGS